MLPSTHDRRPRATAPVRVLTLTWSDPSAPRPGDALHAVSLNSTPTQKRVCCITDLAEPTIAYRKPLGVGFTHDLDCALAPSDSALESSVQSPLPAYSIAARAVAPTNRRLSPRFLIAIVSAENRRRTRPTDPAISATILHPFDLLKE